MPATTPPADACGGGAAGSRAGQFDIHCIDPLLAFDHSCFTRIIGAAKARASDAHHAADRNPHDRS